MRILFLTFQFPYPPDNGARIKSLSILEYLRTRHEVSVRCLTRQAPDKEQRQWANGFGDVRWAVLDRGRNPLNLARSYFSGVPLSVERNRSAGMSRLVSEAMGGGPYHAVVVDGWLMAQYLPEGFAGRALLHEHNAEYVIWERQARTDTNPVRRLVTEREARRVRAYESGILGRFDAVFAVSEQDREALVAIGADPARTRVLPNLPEASLLDMPPLSFEDSQPVILYFGTLSWQPNIEGLERFIREIFPLVRKESPQARLLVAGRGAPAELVRLGRGAPGVDFLGPAPDAEALYRGARVFVEATRSGGGTKLKILNALARGLPVVASVEAAEGIEATAGEHLLIAGDDETMAADIVRLLSDGGLWGKLSANGRALVRAKYVAEKAFAVLDEVLSGDRSRA
ncbi:MAG TPA: glycosyltransferase family 4 protein [Dehalococcoidia bacterium]|nr:glycosyltransferase family 4 protein [Dehalococcoidia bacterium]